MVNMNVKKLQEEGNHIYHSILKSAVILPWIVFLFTWIIENAQIGIIEHFLGGGGCWDNDIHSVHPYLFSSFSPQSPAQCACPAARAGGWHSTHTWWPSLRCCIHWVWMPALCWHPFVNDVNWNWTQYLFYRDTHTQTKLRLNTKLKSI